MSGDPQRSTRRQLAFAAAVLGAVLLNAAVAAAGSQFAPPKEVVRTYDVRVTGSAKTTFPDWAGPGVDGVYAETWAHTYKGVKLIVRTWSSPSRVDVFTVENKQVDRRKRTNGFMSATTTYRTTGSAPCSQSWRIPAGTPALLGLTPIWDYSR